MNISEKYNEQKNKIILAGLNLFTKKGYAATTLNDILSEAGIAKGTFYHYFKSKDEIFDAVVSLYIEEGTKKAENILKCDIPAIEKFKLIFSISDSADDNDKKIHDELHKKNDLIMHFRSYIGVAKNLGPIIGQIIQQGIKEGVFKTDYPYDFAEYMLISQILIDDAFFERTPEELKQKMMFLADLIEQYLKAEKGTFSFLYTYKK